MKKRILGLLLCFVMLAALLPVSALARSSTSFMYMPCTSAIAGKSLVLHAWPDEYYVEEHDYYKYDSAKVTFHLKDPGITGATITDGDVFYASKPGTAIITAKTINGLGAGKDYVEDFLITVEDTDAVVAAGNAVWDYDSGTLLSGTIPIGVSYNASNHTLTLNNATITSAYVKNTMAVIDNEEAVVETYSCAYGIYCDKDLTVQLQGSSSIILDEDDNVDYQIPFGDIAMTGGKITICGDGKLTTSQEPQNHIGITEIHNAKIVCPSLQATKLKVNNGVIEATTDGIQVIDMFVEGQNANVYAHSNDLLGIWVGCDVCANSQIIVKGGTVIAHSEVDWACGFYGSDDDSRNYAPKIHPSYTEARVWMGMTEEEALAKGPQEQSVLVDNNGMRYIKIAPLPKTPDEPDQPVPPDLPVTGDSTHLGLLLFLCVASGAACILFLKRKKTYAAK